MDKLVKIKYVLKNDDSVLKKLIHFRIFYEILNHKQVLTRSFQINSRHFVELMNSDLNEFFSITEDNFFFLINFI